MKKIIVFGLVLLMCLSLVSAPTEEAMDQGTSACSNDDWEPNYECYNDKDCESGRSCVLGECNYNYVDCSEISLVGECIGQSDCKWSGGVCYFLDNDDYVDADSDGYLTYQDCDDTNPEIYPGAQEVCNGYDDDCDGEYDEGCGENLEWCDSGEYCTDYYQCFDAGNNNYCYEGCCMEYCDAVGLEEDGSISLVAVLVDNTIDQDDDGFNLRSGLELSEVNKGELDDDTNDYAYSDQCSNDDWDLLEDTGYQCLTNDDCPDYSDKNSNYYSSDYYGMYCNRGYCQSGSLKCSYFDLNECGKSASHFDDMGATVCVTNVNECKEVVSDNDKDGVSSINDCDDENPSIYEGATEYCGGDDEDCDGETNDDDSCSTDCGANLECSEHFDCKDSGDNNYCYQGCCMEYCDAVGLIGDNIGKSYKQNGLGGISGQSCENNLDCNDGEVCKDETCTAFCGQGSITECNDGLDNDGDGLIDLDDDRCINEAMLYEGQPRCSDLYDNDGDGLIDLDDTDCTSEDDDMERGFGMQKAAGVEQGFFAKVFDFLIFWN